MPLKGMFGDLMRALAQLSDPVSRSLVLRALAITLAVFLLVWLAAWQGFGQLGEWLEAWGTRQGWSAFWVEFLAYTYGAGAVLAVVLASFLFFPAIAGLVLTFFLDAIATAVETRYYPELPPAREQPLAEAIGGGLRLALVTVFLNLLLLPLYFIPLLNLFVFYALNGYLLGREYFELAAARRLGAEEARHLRRRHAGRIFVAGITIAILLTLPLLNLVMPIVATAFMLHRFEALRRGRGAGAAA